MRSRVMEAKRNEIEERLGGSVQSRQYADNSYKCMVGTRHCSCQKNNSNFRPNSDQALVQSPAIYKSLEIRASSFSRASTLSTLLSFLSKRHSGPPKAFATTKSFSAARFSSRHCRASHNHSQSFLRPCCHSSSLNTRQTHCHHTP